MYKKNGLCSAAASLMKSVAAFTYLGASVVESTGCWMMVLFSSNGNHMVLFTSFPQWCELGKRRVCVVLSCNLAIDSDDSGNGNADAVRCLS